MIFGANEATTVSGATKTTIVEGKELHFGFGEFDAAKVIGIVDAPEADSKIRFVAGTEESGNSGMVFVGNKLVSSKILNIVTNEVAKKVFDENTGDYIESVTDKVADEVTVTWFGTATDPADNQVKTLVWTNKFAIIDRDSVDEMIKKNRAEVDEKFDEVDSSIVRLDTSVSGIETFISSDVVTEATDGALTVTATADTNGYKSYELGVNVDASTVKVVGDKLAVATYSIDKIDSIDESADFDPDLWSAQYRLMMTDPETGEATQVGETINIIKDMVVKDAHVCTFKYVSKDGQEINYDQEDQWGEVHKIAFGDPVTSEGALPWAKLSDGTWEKAVLGKDICYGHTYLHMIINTNPTPEKDADGNEGNDQLTDVYLDFTQIFKSFVGDGKFIEVTENGVIQLKADAVVDYIDTSLGITDKFTELDSSIVELKDVDASIIDHLEVTDASLADYIEVTDNHLTEIDSSITDLKAADTSIEEHIEKLDASVTAIEDSYLTTVDLEAPKADNDQFNTLKITQKAAGVDSEITVDVANASFYTSLDESLKTLNENDEYLAGLLTWETL